VRASVRVSDNQWLIVLGLAGLATVVRLVPAALFFGTSDVMGWELLGRLLLQGENFYATQLHNWPVLWIYFAAAALQVHEATGLPFSFLVKVPPILADACIAVMLWRVDASRAALAAAIAYALHPIAVLISGYHGQFDSLMLAPMFLAWRLFEARRITWSAVVLGLGVWFKPVPLLLLPVFLPRLQTWKARLMFSALSVAPAALGTLPYLLRWPEDVAINFFGYSSWFGQWGYPVAWMLVEYLKDHTIPWWLPDPEYVSPPLQAMYAAGRWLLLAGLVAVWVVSFRRGFSTLRSILATFSVFYFVTVGFGLQYLLWIVPFALAARDRMVWPFTVAATGLLLTAYLVGQAYLAPESVLAALEFAEPNTREFLVKLATLPTWLVCGVWAAMLTVRPPAAVRSPWSAPRVAARPARATDST
jgi:hypothetical protein